jgi:hypothetical protein
MANIKIGTPYPAPGITADRFGKQDMVIPYSIDDTGPFNVRVPLEGYTPEVGIEAVKKQATSQAALINKTFTI